jgi:hypothetical protein
MSPLDEIGRFTRKVESDLVNRAGPGSRVPPADATR